MWKAGLISLALMLSSCTSTIHPVVGPQGPAGPTGSQGSAGGISDCSVGKQLPDGGYTFFCDDPNNKVLPIGKIGLEAAPSDFGPNNIQDISYDTNDTPDGGTYTLSFGGNTTPAILYNADANAINAALAAAMPSSLSDLVATGDMSPDGWIEINFGGTYALTSVALITVDATLLTLGGTPVVSPPRVEGSPVSFVWSDVADTSVGVTGVAIGTGQANTALIIAQSHNSAAYLCDQEIIDGDSGWFLPSEAELYFIYLMFNEYGVGGFSSNNYYWSSSEDGTSNALTQNIHIGFGSMSPNSSFKNRTGFVRCARAF